jgi:hypothetical protein
MLEIIDHFRANPILIASFIIVAILFLQNIRRDGISDEGLLVAKVLFFGVILFALQDLPRSDIWIVELGQGIVELVLTLYTFFLMIALLATGNDESTLATEKPSSSSPSPRKSSYTEDDVQGILNSVVDIFPNKGFSELPVLTQVLVAIMELGELKEWRQVEVLAEYALTDPGLKDLDRTLVQGSLLEAKKNLNSSTDLFKEWQKLPSHSGGHRCSVGTGFWGTEECGEHASHLCQRCMKYACRSHITTQRTYGGEAVCETCNRGMQDDA